MKDVNPQPFDSKQERKQNVNVCVYKACLRGGLKGGEGLFMVGGGVND